MGADEKGCDIRREYCNGVWESREIDDLDAAAAFRHNVEVVKVGFEFAIGITCSRARDERGLMKRVGKITQIDDSSSSVAPDYCIFPTVNVCITPDRGVVGPLRIHLPMSLVVPEKLNVETDLGREEAGHREEKKMTEGLSHPT